MINNKNRYLIFYIFTGMRVDELMDKLVELLNKLDGRIEKVIDSYRIITIHFKAKKSKHNNKIINEIYKLCDKSGFEFDAEDLRYESGYFTVHISKIMGIKIGIPDELDWIIAQIYRNLTERLP